MATNSVQETLDRLLDELRSNESSRCLAALQELKTFKYSSPAIVGLLEKHALHHPEDEVREAARQSLAWPVHQAIRARTTHLNRHDRTLVLKQIEQWDQEGLLESRVTDVLKRRYDFDIASPSAPSKPTSVTGAGPRPSPAPPQPVATAPRPSLTQTLLSEASIRIYLYLGAFFVIAAALILAAVVEAARLLILTVATIGFGGAALLLHKRLPQPSFALFIVFSFLLPIDANVIEETIGFAEPSLSIYWTLVFLILAGIWGWSLWFYTSRLFSAVAFISLSLAFYRFGQIFAGEVELQIFLGILASLAGLAATSLLKTWRGQEFSLYPFLLAQLQVLGALAVSLGLSLDHTIGTTVPGGWWILTALTWIAAALFYAWSGIIFPGFVFPWLSVGALLPLPWFLLQALDAAQVVSAFGFWLWGAAFALTSEAIVRSSSERIGKYSWPFLAGSVPLFLTAFTIAFVQGNPVVLFAILALAALAYAALHLIRPRWYVWSAALLAGLPAFFTFFFLPDIEPLEVPVAFQVLIASLLLVVPELFTKSTLSLSAATRVPTIASGIFMSVLGTALALVDLENTGRGAVLLLVYAVLLILHGLHGKRAWLGYFASAAASVAVVYALDHFHFDLWLPALTLAAMIYYTTGYFLRQRTDEYKSWGKVLVNSGLALGSLLSLAGLVLLKETSGWYILLVALLFAVELFARPWPLLEIAVEAWLSLALYLILDDFGVKADGHFLFGASLIWLGGDLLFGRLIQEKRPYQAISLSAGYVLALLGTLDLWSSSDPVMPAIYFALYALFFAFSATVHHEPGLGFFAAAFLPAAIIKFCELLEVEKWIFPLILLSMLYYASGFWLRRNHRSPGWERTLLYSGLGLGVITSMAAPFQGGLDVSIPIAIAATLFAVEAFARRSVWWALPANGLYLLSYFTILAKLDVDEPQFYSIGAALLGMAMHVLLTQAGSRNGGFIAGMLSQLVLLGTTYLQMVATERLFFFFILFVQSMLVLVYGLIQRSRSLVITPIAFAVIGVMTVVYSALKGLGPVILIGSTGLVLLTAGIVAVLMRERITKLGEQLSDWKP